MNPALTNLTATGTARRTRMTRGSLVLAARENPAVFTQVVIKHDKTGRAIRLAQMHRAWHQLISQHKRLVLWSCVESGKTVNVSISRVLWEVGKDPTLRVLILSNTHGQASKLISALAGYIEHDPELHQVFPELVPTKRPTESWKPLSGQLTIKRPTLAKDATITAAGVHGNILGARYDLVILDDVLDVENTRTAEQRQGLIDWINATVIGRLTAQARVVVVGTAFHPDDALHYFAKLYSHDGVQRAFRYPVVDDEGRPRWPEQWPMARIEARRQEAGALEFARQMLCIPRNDATAVFKQAWIDTCLQLGAAKEMAYGIERVPAGYATYTGVDLAVQQHAAADLTVLTSIIVGPDGRKEVLWIDAGRWHGHEIVDHIKDHHRRYQSIVMVENNSCFVAGTRVLTHEGYRPIEAVKVGDLVWTHMGRWRRVVDTLVGTSRTLTTVKAKGCLPVRATPNHWFWMRRAGRVPGRAGGQHRPVGEPAWISYGFRDELSYAAVALPKWEAVAPELYLAGTTRRKAQGVQVDEEAALALGLFMAEGHSTKGQVAWTFNRTEAHLAEVVEKAAAAWYCTTARRRGDGTLRVTANGTHLAKALRIGTGPSKCLPLGWMGWPLNLRLALVRGWFMGDGCARVNNGKTKWPAWILTGVSISRDWVMFVRATLAEAGLATMLRVQPPRSSKIGDRVIESRHPLYEVSLARDGTESLRKLMTSRAERTHWMRWWTAEAGAVLHKHAGHLVLDGTHGWSRVPEIEEAPYEEHGGSVYNLVVEEDESYTVEDFIAHNAQEFIAQYARREGIPTRGYTTGRNKVHPEFGVEHLAAEMEGGQWVFPNRGGIPRELNALIGELLQYDPKGHTGDRIMSLWLAREASRLGNMRAEVGYLNLQTR